MECDRGMQGLTSDRRSRRVGPTRCRRGALAREAAAQKGGCSGEAFWGSRDEGSTVRSIRTKGVSSSMADSLTKASRSTSIQDLCRTHACSEDELFQALFITDLLEGEPNVPLEPCWSGWLRSRLLSSNSLAS
ncbi:hypothetical protein B296_00010275 [Ensete ventricosum]|uniref:Uncharacterized protein n=1 Tax=Ensete ventricosum TaxID=4639 RepID=A0A426YUI6_ENSVE|nr:hypothetical protein B296_00010275 [Ensete ventricosum]